MQSMMQGAGAGVMMRGQPYTIVSLSGARRDQRDVCEVCVSYFEKSQSTEHRRGFHQQTPAKILKAGQT
jgi:hypothetical protein